MKTRVLKVDPSAPDPAAIDEAASIVRLGGLVALPTETVYGLAADATNPDAVRRIFEAKGRPSTNPLIVHAADVDGARAVVREWTEAAGRLAAAFWPGPLTLVLARSGLIPDEVTAGLETVGVRVPAVEATRQVIRRAGVPIAAPSANRSNRISPTTAAHVLAQLDARIDLILDGGPTAVGLESTVLDLAHGMPPRVLRPGPITAEQLAAVLGAPVEEEAGTPPAVEAAVSPGLSAVHYAPVVPAYRFEVGEPIPAELLEADAPPLVFGPDELPARGDAIRFPTPEVAARDLYAALHTADRPGATALIVRMPPDRPEWRAVRDRLVRATRVAEGGRSGSGG